MLSSDRTGLRGVSPATVRRPTGPTMPTGGRGRPTSEAMTDPSRSGTRRFSASAETTSWRSTSTPNPMNLERLCPSATSWHCFRSGGVESSRARRRQRLLYGRRTGETRRAAQPPATRVTESLPRTIAPECGPTEAPGRNLRSGRGARGLPGTWADATKEAISRTVWWSSPVAEHKRPRRAHRPPRSPPLRGDLRVPFSRPKSSVT
jgi:hypothetical protein